jgi:hypothetical protein
VARSKEPKDFGLNELRRPRRFEAQDRFLRVREALVLWRWSSPWRIKVLMTACLLMLRSLAKVSSSSSMEAVESTFTRWMGFRIAPEFVKKRETSLPLSAILAMLSAETGFFLRRVFFIKFSLRASCFPRAWGCGEDFGSFAHRNGIAQDITVVPVDKEEKVRWPTWSLRR